MNLTHKFKVLLGKATKFSPFESTFALKYRMNVYALSELVESSIVKKPGRVVCGRESFLSYMSFKLNNYLEKKEAAGHHFEHFFSAFQSSLLFIFLTLKTGKLVLIFCGFPNNFPFPHFSSGLFFSFCL